MSKPSGNSSGGQGLLEELNDAEEKKAAAMNAELARLREAAANASLDSRGCIQVLRRRLQCRRVKQAYRYLLVVDFEATCEQANPDGYRHEIIEFPLVLLDLQAGEEAGEEAAAAEVVDRFHTYCRPRLHPRLSEFCRELTGIRQSDVDSAPAFPDALNAAQAWLERTGATRHPLALAADCQADAATFLRLQCEHDRLPVPAWARTWVNLRLTFQRHYGLEKRQNLAGMLAALGFEFQGNPHCGRDDAENIARVARQLAADGCRLLVNQRLDPGKAPLYWKPVYKAEAEAELRRQLSTRVAKRSSRRRQCEAEHQETAVAEPEAEDSICADETDESLSDLMYLMRLRKGGGAG